jgi:NADP-dependent 3-hydroxy acid dehydrogenase YdfG
MKYAIVTGASRGVGYATCKLLSKNNYHVIAISRNSDKLKFLKSKNIETYKMDITDFNEIDIFYKKYKNITIDLLVNNAGGGKNPEHIINENPDNFNYAYSLNVSGPMYLSKLFTLNMEKSTNATIIFISSMGGKFAYRGGGNYTNAKRALGGLVDTMRLEYPHFGIKITEICPGSIDTYDSGKDSSLKNEDIANAIVWIAGLPSYMNINYLELNHINSGKY